jgi:thioredoxin reductase-like selenoprotein T
MFFMASIYLDNFLSNGVGFVDGANYPASKEKQMIAQFFSFIFLGGIVLLLAGETIFQTLKMEEPELFQTMKANKMTAFMLLFLLNNVGNSILTTGAFEIFVDGELAFSKLETGRFPSGEDLARVMAEHNIAL